MSLWGLAVDEGPYKTLEVTTVAGCRVGCEYCPQDKFARAHRSASTHARLTYEDFKRCIETVPLDVDINFSGYAEPWLNKDCTAMVEYAVGKNHGVKVFSTLVGMTTDDVDRLSNLYLKRIFIHLPDDGTFMKVRVDDDYIAVLRRLIEVNMPTVKFMAIGPVHPRILDTLSPDVIAPRSVISRAGNVSERIIIAPDRLLGSLSCAAQRLYRNVLLPNGDVTLCCMDYGRRHVLGNLLSTDYSRIHSGPAFRDLLERMNGAPGELLCRRCEFAVPN